MPQAKQPEESLILPTPGEIAIYNQFVAGVQPQHIELIDLSARTTPTELQHITVRIDSKFVLTYNKHREDGFTIDARLELWFRSEDGVEVGYLNCTYRLEYYSEVVPTLKLVEQFKQRNAPMAVWPFMREMVLTLTQRFGWSGFVLPSFLIPPITAGTSPEELAAPVRKGRKAARSSKKT